MSLEDRVSHLEAVTRGIDNDIIAINDKLSVIDGRLTTLDARMNEHSHRLARLEQGIELILEKVDGTDKKLDRLENRLFPPNSGDHE